MVVHDPAVQVTVGVDVGLGVGVAVSLGVDGSFYLVV